MKIVLLLILSMLSPTLVIADDVLLDWKRPTERTNNKPMPSEEIDSYTVQDTYEGEVSEIDITDGSVEQFLIADVPVGEHSYVIRVNDTGGRFSAWSSESIVNIFDEVILPPKSMTLSTTVVKVSY